VVVDAEVAAYGYPATVGVVVASMTLAFAPGGASQQWMWAAVLPLVRALKVPETPIVFAAGSTMTIAVPAPVEVVGGFSFAPASLATNAIGAADTDPCGVTALASTHGATDRSALRIVRLLCIRASPLSGCTLLIG